MLLQKKRTVFTFSSSSEFNFSTSCVISHFNNRNTIERLKLTENILRKTIKILGILNRTVPRVPDETFESKPEQIEEHLKITEDENIADSTSYEYRQEPHL